MKNNTPLDENQPKQRLIINIDYDVETAKERTYGKFKILTEQNTQHSYFDQYRDLTEHEKNNFKNKFDNRNYLSIRYRKARGMNLTEELNFSVNKHNYVYSIMFNRLQFRQFFRYR